MKQELKVPFAAPAGSPAVAMIQEYLELGGLFNPELMEHEKVRDMVIMARNEILRLQDFVRTVRDDFDCDSDAHKYGTACRACKAAELLENAGIHRAAEGRPVE